MSDEIIKHYQTEIERLNKDLAEARKEAAKYRTDRSGKIKELTEQNEALQKEHAKLLKKYETEPGELRGEVDRLRGEIRNRDHRSKFDGIAKDLKVRPDALDDLWGLSGYKADSDDINEDAIREAVAKAIENRPYLLAESEAAPSPAPKPGPAGGQGARAINPAGSFTMTQKQAGDPRFVAEHQAAITEASVKGLLHVSG